MVRLYIFMRPMRIVVRLCSSRTKFRVVCFIIIFIVTAIACFLHGFIIANVLHCLQWKTKAAIMDLCDLHRKGKVFGNLCSDLCDNQTVVTLSCYTTHLGKDVVFTAKWHDTRIVMKTKHLETSSYEPFPPIGSLVSDDIRNDSKIRMTLNRLADLSYGFFPFRKATKLADLFYDILIANYGSEISDTNRLTAELSSLWLLIQQHEFLTFQIYRNLDLFPKIVGSCGHFYAVEYLVPMSEFLHHDFETRIELVLNTISLVENLEFEFEDPIRVCDVKLDHFGVNKRNGVRILDADNVYLQNTLIDIVSSSPSNFCLSHRDCSFFDCEMQCDESRNVCNEKTVNKNLQIVCEKIFLPLSYWSSSVFEPYLLHTIPSRLRTRLKSLMSDCVRGVQPSTLAREIRTLLRNG